MNSWIHPAAIMIIGAGLIPFLKGNVRKGYSLLLPVLAFISVITMKEGTYGVYNLLGQDIIFGRVDKLSLIFAFVFTIAAFSMVLFGLKADNRGHYLTAMIYPGGALGVVFAGDLLTVLLFSEFMAFSSLFFVLHGNTRVSTKAAYRYILVHAFSGVMLMGGIIIYYVAQGTFAFNGFGGAELTMGTGLILFSFLINAAVPFLGAWCPDAYPESSIFGGVFLSAFTTKTSIYALCRGYAGLDILIWIGAFTAIYAIIYAVLENDIRRLLSHHIISQVGFMICAIGVGSDMAINGAVAHALANVVYKGLLFMGAGAIIYMTGRRKLTEMGGLYKVMPWTFILFMIGAFSIAATPFTLGFVSKSIILSAVAEKHHMYAWIVLTLASTGTFLSITLKLGYFAFFAKDTGIEAKDPPVSMLYGMAIPAFLCIFWGLYPAHFYHMLPYDMHYEPYTAEHLVFVFQLLLFTAVAFFGFLKVASPKRYIALDTDWFYRKGGKLFMCFAYRVALAADEAVSNAYNTILIKYTKATSEESWTFDKSIVDGAVNGVGAIILRLGRVFRRIQTGQLQHYAIVVLIGVVLLINLLFFFR
ncbi:MAG: Na(+)/H(+) antiporter subunit D [Thermodesulfobacteriota bacterium]